MADKNSKSEIKKTAGCRRWYRYHQTKIPGWHHLDTYQWVIRQWISCLIHRYIPRTSFEF